MITTRIKTAAIATTLATLAVSPGLAQTDTLGVPGPVAFMGQDYALAWTSQPSPEYIKQEYVPAGQSVETFTDMILVEAVSGAVTPIQAATTQAQSIEARKAVDQVANYDLIQNESTGEVLLDFVVSDLSAEPIVVEWNAYRYMPLADGEGVALLALSRRGYGEDGARELLSGLGAIRNQTIAELAKFDAPAISIAQ